MATSLDDAYFMIMTGVWNMGDLETWVEERSEEYFEERIEDYEEKAFDAGREDGYKDAIADAVKAVKYLE